MYPLLKDNQKVFCIKPIFFTLLKGDIIVFKHYKEGLMIKKLAKVNNQGFYVKGISPKSIDSSIFGYIEKKDILYKVLFKF